MKMAAFGEMNSVDLHVIEQSASKFSKYTKNPELFLGCRDEVATGLLKIAKNIYDACRKVDSHDDAQEKSSLPKLMIDGFDDEQIWQQIEMENVWCKEKLIKDVAELATNKTHRKGEEMSSNEDENNDSQDEDEEENDSVNEDEEENESINKDEDKNEVKENKEAKMSHKRKRKTKVDDEFFKLEEMEEFLEAEEAKMNGKIEENDKIDYFQPLSSEGSDDEENPSKKKRYKYDDFFDVISDEDEDDEASADDIFENEEMDETESQIKSTIEIRQAKLKEKIQNLEESNLAEKPWQLMGEATASTRPENSLLQEHAMFDHVQRQAPVITEDTTIKLEDVIKQRIKDHSWNDVERKVKPKEQPFEYKKRIVLDQEKSKISLAQVYEKEYLKLQETEKQEEEVPQHTEIKKMMTSLFYKLDILSNFHFTPKPVVPELKIVNNLPSIVVEEVAPTTATTGSLLAPAEVMAPLQEKGVREKEKTDKLRERRLKKKFQSERRKEKEKSAKLASILNPSSDKGHTKDKIIKELVGKVEKAETKKSKGNFKSKDVFRRLNEISKRTEKKVKKKNM